MLISIFDLAPGTIETSEILNRFGRSAASMLRLRACKVHHRPFGLADPQAEIHILIIKKKSLIKASKLLEQCATDHQKGSHHLIDDSSIDMVPLDEKMRQNQGWAE